MAVPMERCLARLVAPLAKSRMLHAVLLFALASYFAWAQAPQPIETIMERMLAASQDNSLPDFGAAGDAAFQAGAHSSSVVCLRMPKHERAPSHETRRCLTRCRSNSCGAAPRGRSPPSNAGPTGCRCARAARGRKTGRTRRYAWILDSAGCPRLPRIPDQPAGHQVRGKIPLRTAARIGHWAGG